MKEFIRNRKGMKIAVLIEARTDACGLAFVMHGLSGFKEQKHIETFAEAFKKSGFTIVRFDTTNTFGESDGKYEDATVTNYYEDLEDVIEWSKDQVWYQEPFWLAGHSLGGICTALYAEKYPEKVRGLAPISSVISGKLSMESKERLKPEELAKWRETGWEEHVSVSNPRVIKRLPWSHMIDRLKYDLLPEAGKLSMPVLLIVGDKDLEGIRVEDMQMLYDRLSGPKELHVIKDGPHTFRDPAQLKEVKTLFLTWIQKYQTLS